MAGHGGQGSQHATVTQDTMRGGGGIVHITPYPGGGGSGIGGGGGGVMFPSADPDPADAAYTFLKQCGLNPTEDAVEQLTEVFLPCLEIMCERPWDPKGGTWKKSGWLGIMTDIRKKFERLWERGWHHGQRHDDSILDLINYLGMLRRSSPSRWGEWGEPYKGGEE